MAKRVTGVWFEREIFESKAFQKLPATAIRIYLAFLTKRRMRKSTYGGRKEWGIVNNGEIEFTYKEAEAKHGIKQGAFRENRDRLIKFGLIDIAQSGAGLYKSKTLYAISERWRKYGTPEFEEIERKKDPRHVGYQARNKKRGAWQSIEGVEKSTHYRQELERGVKGTQGQAEERLKGERPKRRPRRRRVAAQ